MKLLGQRACSLSRMDVAVVFLGFPKEDTARGPKEEAPRAAPSANFFVSSDDGYVFVPVDVLLMFGWDKTRGPESLGFGVDSETVSVIFRDFLIPIHPSHSRLRNRIHHVGPC